MWLFPWFSPFETIRDDSHNRVTRRVRSITREKRLSLPPPVPHYLSCQKSKHIEEPKISERLSVFFVVELQKICQMYHDRVYLCEGQKWDLEREVRKRDFEVQEKWRAQRQRRTMRGEREQPSDRTSLLIIFHPRRPTRIRRYKGTKPSPIPVSLFALFLRSFPFLYIRFSFDLLFSLSRYFSWRTLAARTQICSGAQTNGKSSHVGNMEESSMMTKFCHPADLCNLDQSCLDNLNDDLFVFFFNLLMRSFCDTRDGTTANNSEKNFSFFSWIWSAATEYFFRWSHIFVLFYSIFPSFSLFFFYRVTYRESIWTLLSFLSSIFTVWLNAHRIHSLFLVTCLVTSLYCLSII